MSECTFANDQVLFRTRPYRILLTVTGSVATIKLQEIIDALVRGDGKDVIHTSTGEGNDSAPIPQYREVRVIMTKSSKHFFKVPRSDAEPCVTVNDEKDVTSGMSDHQRFIHRLNGVSLNRQDRNKNAGSVLVGNPNPSAAVAHQHNTTSSSEVFFYDDECEYTAWQSKGDSVLHIDLKDWADILVVAPMSANTLAKTANGMCDNLLMCVLRAWPCRGSFKPPTPSPNEAWQSPVQSLESLNNPSPPSSSQSHQQHLYKPIVIAPAMNTNMLYHPATRAHMTTLYSWYNKNSSDSKPQQSPTTTINNNAEELDHHHQEHQLFLAGTVQKLLACGVQGDGAMASPDSISLEVETALSYAYCRFTLPSSVQMRRVVEAANRSTFSRYIDIK